jgi:short-subunit dehydrogenase
MTSKLVLVSGASSGIGEATALRYAAAGAHVLLLGRNVERLDRVVESIRRDGGAATPYIVDLADANAIAETSARINREHGTPDILINNAGAGRWLPLLDTRADDALAMIAVPYLAALNLTRDFLPGMIARRSGALAYITSPASFIAWPNASAYTAARRAVAGLAETMQQELRGTGIAVTLVVLGSVETPYWDHNPGSRERLPKSNPILAPILSAQQAAEAIYGGVESGKRMVVKPGILRALFVLNAIAPRLVARQVRRAVPKRQPTSERPD